MHAAKSKWRRGRFEVALTLEAENVLDHNIDRAVIYFKLSARGGNEMTQVMSGDYIQEGDGMDHFRKIDVKRAEGAAKEGQSGARNLFRLTWTNRF